MPQPSLSGFLHGGRSASLGRAAVAIAIIALVDWRFDVDISFGFLYLFPMLMVGAHLTRWQIAGVAALCTVLSEAFGPLHWNAQLGVTRLILAFAAFVGAGLYVFEHCCPAISPTNSAGWKLAVIFPGTRSRGGPVKWALARTA